MFERGVDTSHIDHMFSHSVNLKSSCGDLCDMVAPVYQDNFALNDFDPHFRALIHF